MTPIEIDRINWDAIRQFRSKSAPVTRALVWLTIAVFGFQTLAFVRVRPDGVSALTGMLTQEAALVPLNTALFLTFPGPAWLFSPFIHKGLGHVASNLLLLAVFGRLVEPRLRSGRYLAWFVLAELTITPVFAYVKLATNPEPHVAVYGISGFMVSLAVYVALILNREWETELDLLGVILGIAVTVAVLYHVLEALWIGSIEPLNVAHVGGAVFGALVYLIGSRVGSGSGVVSAD